YLPGVELPESIRLTRAADLEPGAHDLIFLAVPARALPAVLAAHGEQTPRRAGLLVLSKGLAPPLGTLPSRFASDRCRARALAAPILRPSPVWPAPAIWWPPWSRPAPATGARASCWPKVSRLRRSARSWDRPQRLSIRCPCSPPSRVAPSSRCPPWRGSPRWS